MDDAEPDVLAYMTFPKEHRAKLHSTNPIERLNGEIKRRTDVVGMFPNEAAITRIVGAILIEQSDEWAVQRARSMILKTMAPLSDIPIIMLSAVPGTRPARTDAGKHGVTPKLHHVQRHDQPNPTNHAQINSDHRANGGPQLPKYHHATLCRALELKQTSGSND